MSALVGCEGKVPPIQAGDSLPEEALSGGQTTVFDVTRNAFGFSARNLRSDQKRRFFTGNSFFNQNWVEAPASTTARDGLGPTFNALSCSSCHFKDGRAAPYMDEADARPGLALLYRLSVPGPRGPEPVPGYGGQLNPQGIPGVPGEGRARVRWRTLEGRYDDGEPYTLVAPEHTFEQLAYGPMPEDVMVSARAAPSIIGLGLLERIPEEDLLALADPEDRDGDGVRGVPNRVVEALSGELTLGRFGWKANQPSLLQQNAAAFLGDLGITSPLFPQERCESGQEACAGAPSGADEDGFEISAERLDDVTFYTATLAVPGRRAWDSPQVLRGKARFTQIGCDACHVPRHVTGQDPDHPELSGQIIYPYTDLLLHDMGPELADGRPDGLATGSQWRTSPLWGIGLTERVNGHTRFLHDGRARGLAEAILWHGGEGERSRDAFKALDAQARRDLLAFLESL